MVWLWHSPELWGFCGWRYVSTGAASLVYYLTLLVLSFALSTGPLLTLWLLFKPRGANELGHLVALALSTVLMIGYVLNFQWRWDWFLGAGVPFSSDHPRTELYERYLVYLVWLVIPLAFASLARMSDRSVRARCSAAVVSTAILGVAVAILIFGAWSWEGAPGLVRLNAPDIWPYNILNRRTLAVVAALAAATLAAVSFWPKRLAIALCVSGLFVTLDITAMRALAPGQVMSEVVRRATDVLQAGDAMGDGSMLIIDATVGWQPDFFAWSTRFWMEKPPIVVPGAAAGNTVSYSWPATRVGSWVGEPMPRAQPSKIRLLSVGPELPPGAVPLLRVTDSRLFYLQSVAHEQTRKID